MPPAAINLAETFNLPVRRQLPQYISHLSLARQWFKNVAAGESKVGYAGLSEGLKIWRVEMGRGGGPQSTLWLK